MRIGIDLGGTKIEIIALDAQGQILHRQRTATPAGDYRATVQTIYELVSTTEQLLGKQGSVGIGIPGALSPASGVVKNANSTCLIGQPLDKDLQQALSRPVRISNDANCFAVSEAIDGAAAHANVVFGVILGTGVGGGIVINGQPLTGPNAIAGEWGHNPLPWPDTSEQQSDCYCGRFGCIETWLSGPGLSAAHHARFGKSLSAKEIVTLSEQGDAAATKSLERYEDRLARSLASVINILDPNVIVLGGGLSNISRLYQNVPKLWSKYIFSDRVDTRLVENLHGDSSGVRGAAWLWPNQ
ncbi:MAG: ROK family protein [Gammaproteobacteria bacterium]|nr:ROK family protein [Gammaproteobacteria bacterium]